jgi:hypothetical protein
MLVRKNGDLLIHSHRHLIAPSHENWSNPRFSASTFGQRDVWWEARFTSDSRGNDYLLWYNQIFRVNEQSGLQPLPELTKDITAKCLFVDRSDVSVDRHQWSGSPKIRSAINWF